MCGVCDQRYMDVLRLYSRNDGSGHGAAPFAGVPTPAAAHTPPTGEQLILARAIHTMDVAQSVGDAMLISDGRIVAVGERSDLIAQKSATTVVREFGDMTVLPGFIDPHMHSAFAIMRPWLDIGPFTTNSIDDALAKVKSAVVRIKGRDWLLARLLDPSLMPGTPLTRTILDAISPDVPIFALENNGHCAYANSKAFELAGITEDTPDPPHCRYVRDSAGLLTGRLEESNSLERFLAAMPQTSDEALAQFIREDFDDASSNGCTTLHDCGIGALAGIKDLTTLDGVMAANPPVRYSGFLVSTLFDTWREMGITPGQRGPRFSLAGIKAWVDGSNQAQTGYLREPYLNSTGRGTPNYSPEEIVAAIAEADAAGWQVGLHCNGDAGIDMALDGFEAVLAGRSGLERRHRLEHCSLLHPEQITRMQKLGLSPSFLIGHVHYWGHAFQSDILGPERADLLDRCRSSLDAGLRVTLHSDYNVTPIEPLRCIENAVVRNMKYGGGILNAAERITPHEAVRAMTIDAAWQCHLDHECGSLEPGKSADFVVLEKDPMTIDPTEISKIRIHSTWLEGEQRFTAA
jgi:predicted amidohydrolase YtcJ